jgi:hypothetical protein
VSAATVISLVVGAWGAILATILGVRELRRDRRVVRVSCETLWGKNHDGADELFVRIRVVNEGHRPVEARHVLFRSRDGRQAPVPDGLTRGQWQPDNFRQLPRVLGDGESVVVDFETALLEAAQQRLGVTIETVEVMTSVGGPYLAQYPRY